MDVFVLLLKTLANLLTRIHWGSKLFDPNEKSNLPTIWNQEKPIKS